MNKLFSMFLICLAALTAYADTVSLTLENDCFFNRTFKNQDNDYTHGTALELLHEDWRFVLQQNIYTPENIKIPYHEEGSRPYAGWLGAEVGRQLFSDPDSPWSHYAALNFGMVGPSSGAGDVQDWIHKVLGCNRPKDWDTQLHDEFCVNGQWWTKYNWYVSDYVALIPRAGILAGTLEDAVEIGSNLRIGWNIKKCKSVGTNNMMFSAPNPHAINNVSFWDDAIAYLSIGGDCRYYLYNHFLEGSMFDHQDNDVTVDIEPFVGEVTFGAHIEYKGVFLKWYGTIRTHEYETQKKAPDYGGLSLGYRWDF